ncbi:MAG: FkbM family methyltransferase [Actinomycetota bacterium]
MRLMRLCGHSFVSDFLGEAPVVLDCGSNRGEFARKLADGFGARVFGFEPDPRLFAALPELDGVFFFDLAVSSRAQDMVLNLGVRNCSSARFQEEAGQDAAVVKAVSLDGFCAEKSIARIDLLKLDIEGAEIEVLESLPDGFLGAVGQVTVEFHDFLDAAEGPGIRRVVERMRQGGFDLVKFSHHDHSDCLFVNRRRHPLGATGKAELLLKKYCRGISRKLGRLLAEPEPGP